MAVTLKSPYAYTQDLTKPIGVVYRPEIVFTKDNLADKISVALYNGTEAASVVGAVTGTVIRADRSTVPIENGTITGNVVTVALTREQIEIPGQLQVFIKLTSGDVEATIFAGVFTAIRTETETVIDPGTVISSVSQLITDIRNAIGSIPADLTQLMTAIAPIYSSEQTYGKGAYCWYSGDLYQSKVAITTPEEWTASHWLKVVLTTHIRNLEQLPDRLGTDEEVLNNLLPTVDHFMAPADYEQGRYINARTGAVFTPADDFCTTDYINISGFRRIAFDRIRLESTTIMQENVDYRTIDVSNLGMSFYDANKNPIGFTTAQIAEFDSSQERGYADQMSILQVPTGAVYARFTKLRDYDTYGGFSLIGTTAGEANESDIKSLQQVQQRLTDYVAGTRFEGTKTTEDGRTSMISLSAVFPDNEIPVFAIFGTRLGTARIMYGSDDHIEYYASYEAPDAMMWSPAVHRNVETVDFIFSTVEPGRTVRVVAATGIEAVKLKAEVEAITARQPCIRYDIDQDLRLKPNQQAIARANLGLTFSETSDGVIVIS